MPTNCYILKANCCVLEFTTKFRCIEDVSTLSSNHCDFCLHDGHRRGTCNARRCYYCTEEGHEFIDCKMFQRAQCKKPGNSANRAGREPTTSKEPGSIRASKSQNNVRKSVESWRRPLNSMEYFNIVEEKGFSRKNSTTSLNVIIKRKLYSWQWTLNTVQL